ncbi:MAG: Rpn family recombination-promoting nuclease/putative transposase [Opitutaceae bacterium]|nr:Rpn family recombination-promoting nuclease/putative transposase [Opitutaceae bacterium]
MKTDSMQQARRKRQKDVPDPLHQPHDKLVQNAFEDIPTLIAFLEAYLLPNVRRWLDLREKCVVHVNDSFVSRKLKASEADLLFQVASKTGAKGRPDTVAGTKAKVGARAGAVGREPEVFVYVLIEHQYRKDRWIVLRVLRYMIDIWEAYLEKNPGVRTLPVILPVVLAQNKKAWRVSAEFGPELFGLTGEAAGDLAAFIPKFSVRFLELALLAFDELRGTALGTLTLRVLKAQQEGGDAVLNDYVWDESLMRKIGLGRRLDRIINYIIGACGVDSRKVKTRIDTIESESIRKMFKSTAQQFIEEGIEEGIEKGELIGCIYTMQELLGKKVTPRVQLKRKSIAALQTLLEKLRAEHRSL